MKVNGELLGGTVLLTDVVSTRAKAPRDVRARVAREASTSAPLARIVGDHKAEADESVAATVGQPRWEGSSGGSSSPSDVPLDDPAHAQGDASCWGPR